MTDTTPADEISAMMLAGSKALAMNSPIGEERLSALIAGIDADGSPLVDFGCGSGTFLRRAALGYPTLTGIGIDMKVDSISDAERAVIDAGVETRISFLCQDASTWSGPVGTALCSGSSHAFGGPPQMFARLHQLGAERAVIGDGVWSGEPDQWCLDNLGDMPRGLDEISQLAETAGWVIDDASVASLDEWDAFESTWGDGVRSVGTEAAVAFADTRAAEYQRYRGVLGFAWLQLSRAGSNSG